MTTPIQFALDRLQLDLSEIRGSTLAGKIDPSHYVTQLPATLKLLESKINKAVQPRIRIDVEELWSKWERTNYTLDALDIRDIRALCTSPLTAMRPQLIPALAKTPSSIKRVSTLQGLINVYFAQWRTMKRPDEIERFIVQTLADIDPRRRSAVLNVWRKSFLLFSSQAPKFIGENALKNRKFVAGVCAELFVEKTTPLAEAAAEEATNLATNAMLEKQHTAGEQGILHELKWISEMLLVPPLSPAAYRVTIGKLILSGVPEKFPAFQTALVDQVHRDERLGDLRLPHGALNWRTMPVQAQERFRAWLAKETLQFFFNTLVPRNDQNRRRADFWLGYAKRQGNIKDFQVVVSSADKPKISASRTELVPNYSSIIDANTSAFIMVFQGYRQDHIVIEFSETGNAAYVYTRSVFESSGVGLRSNVYCLRDLKRKEEAEFRILHMKETLRGWETKARQMLAELGIKP